MLGRLLFALVVPVTLFAACSTGSPQPRALSTTAPPTTPAPSPTASPQGTVLVYGDSLTVESEAAARALFPGRRFVFRAEGGAGPCNFAPSAAADRVRYRPAKVVLAFTGNVSQCSLAAFRTAHLSGVVANYESALGAFRRAFAGLPITLISPPAVNSTSPDYPAWFPYNSNPALIAMYRRVCASSGMTYSTKADDYLTPGHVFRFDGPKFRNGPIVRLRLPDGLHLTPDGSAWYAAAIAAW
jgi:hypothetical protein